MQWQRRLKSPGYTWENCTRQEAEDVSNSPYWDVRQVPPHSDK